MIKTTKMLSDELASFGNTGTKIGRMVEHGELVPIKRGLYETNPHAPGRCLAGSVYGPSYLSFEYALSEHGLIPEVVRVYTSATCAKRKAKHFDTPFGTYEYRDVPVAVFRFGVSLVHEGDYAFWMATPEKALCDELYTLSPIGSQRNLETLLLEDLRVDESSLAQLDAHAIESLAERYRCRNVALLVAFLGKRGLWTR